MSKTPVILDHKDILRGERDRRHFEEIPLLIEPTLPDTRQSALGDYPAVERPGYNAGCAGLLLVLMLMAGLFVALAVMMRYG